jgi:hypothetical protein
MLDLSSSLIYHPQKHAPNGRGDGQKHADSERHHPIIGYQLQKALRHKEGELVTVISPPAQKSRFPIL